MEVELCIRRKLSLLWRSSILCFAAGSSGRARYDATGKAWSLRNGLLIRGHTYSPHQADCLSTAKMNGTTVARCLRGVSRQVAVTHHTPVRIPRLPAQPQPQRRLCSCSPTPPSLLRAQPLAQRVAHQTRRKSSDVEAGKPLTDTVLYSPNAEDPDDTAARRAEEPAYEMTFTCRKCLERSSHRITKQAYHFGTTLITCPGCKNRHLISDHLKVRTKLEDC